MDIAVEEVAGSSKKADPRPSSREVPTHLNHGSDAVLGQIGHPPQNVVFRARYFSVVDPRFGRRRGGRRFRKKIDEILLQYESVHHRYSPVG